MIEERKKVNLHSLRYNLATKYLINTLDINSKGVTFKLLKELGFINAYLIDMGYDHKVSDTLTLVFSIPSSFKDNFFNFIKELEKDVPNYLLHYEIDINTYGVLFKIAEKFKPIIPLFLEGKYSKFGKGYADFFKETSQGKINYLSQYKIILKDKDYQYALENKIGLEEGELDNSELDDIPQEKDYIFDYEQLIKNKNE
jgi:hypothetical protein